MKWLVVVVLIIQVCLILAAPYNGKPLANFPERTQHQVSGSIKVADDKTLVIENFVYDGTAPDAFIWIGSTASPDTTGTIVPITPGLEQKLSAYNGETLTVRIPGTATLLNYKWISIWCRSFTANFGHVLIPADYVLPAPFSLGALPNFAHAVRATDVTVINSKKLLFTNLDYDGAGPDAYFWAFPRNGLGSEGTKMIWDTGKTNAGKNQRIPQSYNGVTIEVFFPDGMTIYDVDRIGLWCVLARQDFGSIEYDLNGVYVPLYVTPMMESAFPNCEVLLEDEFQVRWQINEAEGSIMVEMAGRVEPGHYLAFGRSGSDSRTLMDGSDVAVAWMDQDSMGPTVVDYNLQSKAQCSVNDGNGACPDTTHNVNGTNDVRLGDLLIGDGITRISYTRPLNTNDPIDRVIPLDEEVYISWAIGPINPDGRVAKHTIAPNPGENPKINFGRPSSVCPAFADKNGGGSQLPAWPVLTIDDETTLRVDIGQSGGERGYTGITGKTGWGIAWYLNGLLIPELHVKRGVNYTFEVYGGNDPENSAQYHPFYITNDPVGGYAQKLPQEKEGIVIYAGPAEGPFCNWEEKDISITPDSYNSFGGYKSELERNCMGSSTVGGRMHWMPDKTTPDVVYYQCYTHRFLGWKIKVNSAIGVQASAGLLLAMLGVISLLS